MKTDDLLKYGIIAGGVWYFFIKPKTPALPASAQAQTAAKLTTGQVTPTSPITQAGNNVFTAAATSVQNIIKALAGGGNTPNPANDITTPENTTSDSIQQLAPDLTQTGLSMPVARPLLMYAGNVPGGAFDSGYYG